MMFLWLSVLLLLSLFAVGDRYFVVNDGVVIHALLLFFFVFVSVVVRNCSFVIFANCVDVIVVIAVVLFVAVWWHCCC